MRKRVLFLAVLLLAASLCFGGCGGEKATPASAFEYSGSEGITIKKYIGDDKTVVIPETIEGKPVVLISTGAFADRGIETIVIPSTVTSIWRLAFARCTALKEVIFRDGTERQEIMESAFEDCTALTELRLAENLEKVGTRAFGNCSALKKVHIPKNLNEMGMEVFSGCPIEALTFEDGIRKVGTYASFWSAKFTELHLPASVEELGGYGFHNNVQKVYFSGDAPQKVGKQPFGENATIYYPKGAKGWDETALKDEYPLQAE